MLSSVKNTKTCWEIINKYNFKKLKLENIDLITWNNFLPGMFPPRDYTDYSMYMMDFGNPILDSPISKREIIVSLNKCKNNKSPGPDGISYEFLKNLPENGLHYISKMFNEILSTNKIP